MVFFKRKKEKENDEPIAAAVIANPVSSAIFQDILKKEGIPFICHQEGAGAYLKLLLGVASAPDYILVSPKNYERARMLYEAYLLTETEPDMSENGSDDTTEEEQE